MRRKGKKAKISNYVSITLAVLVSLTLMLEAVRLVHVKTHVADNEVKKVSSTYELKQSWYVRNGFYYFLLPNGDRLSVARDIVENRKLLENQEELLFTYASPRGGIRFTYACVEIASVDEETCFVNREVALRQLTVIMWVYFVSSGFFVFFVVKWWIGDFKYSKRYLRWKQKRYVEQRRKKKQTALKQLDGQDKKKKRSP